MYARPFLPLAPPAFTRNGLAGQTTQCTQPHAENYGRPPGKVHSRTNYGNIFNYWGEPERAPHVRVVQRVRLYIYNYIYIYISYILGHGANLYRVQNGQDGRPLRSHCVRLKYSPRIASNGKEIVRYETDTPTSPLGKDTRIGRRNHAN